MKLLDSNYGLGMIRELKDISDTEIFMYRPYFFEFTVDLNKLKSEEKKILTDDDVVGKWIEASFVPMNHTIKENMHAFPGTVLSSASPIKTDRRTLIIQDKNIKQIPADINRCIRVQYDTSKAIKTIDEIKIVLDRQFANPEPSDYKVRIYNVGDGNYIYIHSDNGRRVLFDIGHNCNPYSYDWRDPIIRRSKDAIKKMKPHITIISHWDLDHIIGVVFAKQWIFRHPWIAPNLNVLPEGQVSIGALRVAKYLELYNQLFLVDNKDRNKLIYSTSNFKVWCGKGKVKGKSLTETNNAGLIIEIKNKDVLTLLTGDCEYLALADGLNFSKKRYNHLVIPHHCSKMNTSPLNCTPSSGDFAIISVSKSNKKRPNVEHKDYLENEAKYLVEKTGDYFCIEISSLDTKGIKFLP